MKNLKQAFILYTKFLKYFLVKKIKGIKEERIPISLPSDFKSKKFINIRETVRLIITTNKYTFEIIKIFPEDLFSLNHKFFKWAKNPIEIAILYV